MCARLLKKAYRDFFHNKKKAIVAVLAIFIGMISFGMLLFSEEIITNELVTTYSGINPPSGIITVDKVDNRTLEILDENEDISEYEIRARYEMRGQLSDGEWTSAELFAADDYSDIKVNQIIYVEGKENPGKDEVLMDQDALSIAGKELGDKIILQLPDGTEKEFLIAGVVSDLTVHPATMHHCVYAYVSTEMLQSLNLKMNRIDFKLKDNEYDRDIILQKGNELLQQLEAENYQVRSFAVENSPGVSMHLKEYETALMLLKIFAFVAFLFGCFIMSSLITSILNQQVRQIGILKSFGTKGNNILAAYMTSFFSMIVGLVAIAVPLAKLTANQLSKVLLRISNMNLEHKDLSAWYYIFFAFISMLVPVLVVLLTTKKATKISIKEAISEHKSKIAKGKSVDIKMKNTSKVLVVRNMFSKKKRLALNVTTMALAGACFVVILVSMLSVKKTLEHNLNTNSYDYHFITKNEDSLGNKLNDIEDISDYEMWGYSTGKFVDEDGNLGNVYPVYGVKENSDFYEPDMVEGRWIDEADANADEIVVGSKFLKDHDDIDVDDTITLIIGGNKKTFKVVGIVKDLAAANLYMSNNQMEQLVSDKMRQTMVQLHISDDASVDDDFYQDLEKEIADKNISVLQSETKDNAIEMLNSHYDSTFQTFLIVIGMILIVSSFGLASTTKIQTMERVREIGVMKSMGTTKKQIVKIITSESVWTCLIGWVGTAILSIPGIIIGIKYFSKTTLQASIQVYWLGILIAYVLWFVLGYIIGKITSHQTAVHAAKMTIRESLGLE